MFNCKQCNRRRLLLTLGLCFFLGTFGVRELWAQPCDFVGLSVPGEVVYPAGWKPEIIPPPPPQGACINRGLANVHTFVPSGATPPVSWSVSVSSGSTEQSVDESGNLNVKLSDNACGTVVVSLVDAEKRFASTAVCIEQGSYWKLILAEGDCVQCFFCNGQYCYSTYARYQNWASRPGYCSGRETLGLGPLCPSCTPGNDDFVGYIAVEIRACYGQ